MFRVPACVVLLFASAFAASADQIQIQKGRLVTGDIVLDECDTNVVTIKTVFGNLKVSRKQIARIEFESDTAEKYTEEEKNYALSAADQFKLALAIKEKDKGDSEEYFRRVIVLDPNHERARKELGYKLYGDKWMTFEQYKESEGYVYYKGRWMFPQDRDRLVEKNETAAAEKEFYRKLRVAQKMLREKKEVRGKNRADEARKEVLAMTDPLAIKPLYRVLGESEMEEERALFVEVMASIKHPDATSGLLRIALEDKERGNRRLAIDAVIPRKNPQMVKDIAKYLKSRENDMVENAGLILADIGDDSVVPDLIDALVTKHRYVIKPSFYDQMRGASGYQVQGQPGIGGDGFRTGTPPGPRIIIKHEKNVEVLGALQELTGQNFGFDKERWRLWLKKEFLDKAKPAPSP